MSMPRFLYWWTSPTDCELRDGSGEGGFLKSVVTSSVFYTFIAPVWKVGHYRAMLNIWAFPKWYHQCHKQTKNVTCITKALALMYSINRRRERTQPWGEPVEEKTPFNAISQHIRLWLTLCLNSFWAKICGWIHLKADVKSIKNKHTKELAFSKWVKIKFKSVLVASTSPLPVDLS